MLSEKYVIVLGTVDLISFTKIKSFNPLEFIHDRVYNEEPSKEEIEQVLNKYQGRYIARIEKFYAYS